MSMLNQSYGAIASCVWRLGDSRRCLAVEICRDSHVENDICLFFERPVLSIGSLLVAAG